MAVGLLLACAAIIAVNLVIENDHEIIRSSKVSCPLTPSPLWVNLARRETSGPAVPPFWTPRAPTVSPHPGLQEMLTSDPRESEAAWLSSAFGDTNKDSDDALVDEVSLRSFTLAAFFQVS